jgi:hypothetical protein
MEIASDPPATADAQVSAVLELIGYSVTVVPFT